jgi:hypothetical protein
LARRECSRWSYSLTILTFGPLVVCPFEKLAEYDSQFRPQPFASFTIDQDHMTIECDISATLAAIMIAPFPITANVSRIIGTIARSARLRDHRFRRHPNVLVTR